jgi:formate hydrogenlyase transcriptional activator
MPQTNILRMKSYQQNHDGNPSSDNFSKHDFVGIIGHCDPLRKIEAQAALVAPTNTTVLIEGETGTGKELMAQAVYLLSARNQRPFIKVNCAALSPTLIESELFGHEKGAFTGAMTMRVGRFELADKATIFLDEIGELPLDLQAKLLRALQEGEFERLGSSRTLKADVRVIAATNQNLENAVRKGRFRAELFYRLNVFPLRVPPLRERRDDIPLLSRFFIGKAANQLGKRIQIIPEEALETLERYYWPGNIRELKNVLERAAILTEGERLWFHEESLLNRAVEAAEDAQPAPVAEATPPYGRLDDVEREHILQVLERTYWRIEGKHGAAIILGLNPGTLRARMNKLGIKRPIQKRA